MIEVRGLTLSRWDYMGAAVEGGMMPAYKECFASHPFPCFTNPMGMGALVHVFLLLGDTIESIKGTGSLFFDPTKKNGIRCRCLRQQRTRSTF